MLTEADTHLKNSSKETESDPLLPAVDVDESFRERQTYLQGRLTVPPDFSVYDQMLDEQHDDEQEDRKDG